jgi:hypothetical protein
MTHVISELVSPHIGDWSEKEVRQLISAFLVSFFNFPSKIMSVQ